MRCQNWRGKPRPTRRMTDDRGRTRDDRRKNEQSTSNIESRPKRDSAKSFVSNVEVKGKMVCGAHPADKSRMSPFSGFGPEADGADYVLFDDYGFGDDEAAVAEI